MTGRLFLLGPQRPTPNLGEVLESIGGAGPIVTITAGWRNDEGETEALHAVAGKRAMHLPLYAWFEECMERMPETRELYRRRQTELKRLKELYRVRLACALSAVRELTERAASGTTLAARQLQRAIEDVRRIDAQFIDDAKDVFAAYPEVARPWELPEVRARRRESAEKLSAASVVLLAGGHVAVLRNRMLFFGVHQQLFQAWRQHTAVVGWGAGAMVLTERIVLFYDDPPDGPAHPEIFDTGLAMATDMVLLPDARKRLRLDDAMRVALLAGRFGPNRCIGMENGAWLELEGAEWVHHGADGSTMVLSADGSLEALAKILELVESIRATPTRADALLADFVRSNQFPLVEGDTATFFFWDGKPTKALNLMHWVFGLETQQAFDRILGTEAFYLSLELPHSARVEYKFELARGGKRRWIQIP